MLIFRAVLFIIVQTWKQPKRPSASEWRNFGTSINRKLFMTKKKCAVKLSSHEKTERKLKCILLNESTQSEKDANYDFNIMTFWKRPTMGSVKRSGVNGFGSKRRGMNG